MPALVTDSSSKKRKSGKNASGPSSKRRAVADDNFAEKLSTIQELENQIAESRKGYNNIATLLSMLNVEKSAENPEMAVAVSLCRVFSRLIAGGNLTESSRAAENEKIIVAWLKERCLDYQNALVAIMREADAASQIAALTLSMRIVKERLAHIPGAENNVWSTGFFKDIFAAIIEAHNGEDLQSEAVAKFVKEYEDVRYYTFTQMADYASTTRSPEILEILIKILQTCDEVPGPEHKFENFYAKRDTKNKRLVSANSHRKQAQEAWLAILRNNLSQSQRKSLLRMMVHNIEPWFNRPELLMDFLTDSYNVGGATSLLALSGLFYLIQEKNLDYPQFYTKLLRAAALKAQITILPIAEHLLVLNPSSVHIGGQLHQASRSPCSERSSPAIVVIVPFMYNFFKNHPTTTFMMHRSIRDKDLLAQVEKEGMDDPFDPNESDPNMTNAIESSLWEIVTLQSHFHPNVAAIARIISEQFTKQAYSLEDFLDHTYAGMVTADLGVEERNLKKIPVVEYQIPKRIFTDRLLEEDGHVDSGPGCFMRNLWEF
ncbi:CCAAT-binding factor [Penicillium chrysogenum]|nr:CCAAT-binding factor [Penicillium chrysogenum]